MFLEYQIHKPNPISCIVYAERSQPSYTLHSFSCTLFEYNNKLWLTQFLLTVQFHSVVYVSSLSIPFSVLFWSNTLMLVHVFLIFQFKFKYLENSVKYPPARMVLRLQPKHYRTIL